MSMQEELARLHTMNALISEIKARAEWPEHPALDSRLRMLCMKQLDNVYCTEAIAQLANAASEAEAGKYQTTSAYLKKRWADAVTEMANTDARAWLWMLDAEKAAQERYISTGVE